MDGVLTYAVMPTATTHAPHVIYRSSYALLGMFLMNFPSIFAATRGVSSSNNNRSSPLNDFSQHAGVPPH
jgi:hypothetical protein